MQSTLFSALINARDVLIVLPLEGFCLIPVWERRKHSDRTFFFRLILVNLLAFVLTFFSFLCLKHAGEYLAGLLISVLFFVSFREEIDLPFIRLTFLFLSAYPVGGFGLIVYHLTHIFLDPQGTVYDPGNLASLFAQLIFETLTLFLFLPVLRGSLCKVLFRFRGDKPFLPVCVIFLTIFGVCRFVIPIYNERMYIGRVLQIYVVFFLVSLLMFITLYLLFLLVLNSITENEELMEKAVLVDLQAEQYRRLEQYLQETSRLRHDFRFQLSVLTELIKSGKNGEALDFLASLDSRSHEENVIYCASKAVNVLLNHYHARLLEAGAKAEFHISLEGPFFVEDLDLCVVLGNLLENALEAVRKVPERERSVSLLLGETTEEILVLQVENPYAEPVKREGKSFLSSRHLGLGEGMRSVSLVAEKYGGSMRVDDQEGIFRVRVLFRKRGDVPDDL